MKIKDNIVLEFNEFSKNYTADMIGCVPHYLKLMLLFTENLPENFVPNHILDLGCGNGNVTSRLVKLFPESSYVLLDASHEMINLCKSQFGDYNVEYFESYFKDYLFKDDYFDLVTAGFSLHHCDSKEKKKLFQSIYKSLKKGGVFSCSDLMINKKKPEHLKLLSEWRLFVYDNFPDGKKWSWLMEHYNKYDYPDDYFDQIKWLREAGFKIINVPTKPSYWSHFQAIKV